MKPLSVTGLAGHAHNSGRRGVKNGRLGAGGASRRRVVRQRATGGAVETKTARWRRERRNGDEERRSGDENRVAETWRRDKDDKRRDATRVRPAQGGGTPHACLMVGGDCHAVRPSPSPPHTVMVHNVRESRARRVTCCVPCTTYSGNDTQFRLQAVRRRGLSHSCWVSLTCDPLFNGPHDQR